MNSVLSDSSLFLETCWVDGRALPNAAGHTFAVSDPATGAVLGHVPRLDPPEVERAIEAAARAFPTWRARTARERSGILKAWARLVMESQEDLAQLMTAECGKPLAESRGEVAYAASFLDWFAEEAVRVAGETVPSHRADARILVTREPVGVTVGITPWNFPAAMITRKAAPALAAGCPMVVKPAEETPFTALALAVLADRAGVPPGVFSVVTGDPEEIGRVLTGSPVVRKLSFTGSTAVGRQLMQQCAPTVKRLSLELGGNAPFIVFDDADLDAAVDGAMISKFRNSGQTCVCANRFLVQDGIYDAFASGLVERVRALRVGSGADDGVEQGPLINQPGLVKVERLVEDAVKRGASVLYGGKRHSLGGTFYEPTVLGNASSTMQCSREEIFGPVAPLFRFSSESEAISIANDTESGLAAYFYARDLGRVWRVAEALEVGIVGVNTGLISTEAAPFGGVKQSGLGREGSRHGIDEYLETKYVLVAGLDR